jgi:transcriptional regulator with XRE-family HTH domain
MTTPLDVTLRIITPPSLDEVPTAEWGARVSDARRTRRLSQVALARACGVSQQTISKVEHGEICPHDKLKLRLAAALDVPPAALFPWPVRPR